MLAQRDPSKLWRDVITIKTVWKAMLDENNLLYTRLTMVPIGINKQRTLLIRSPCLQEKNLHLLTCHDWLWHPFSAAIHTLMSSAASPVPISDEQWHIRANSYILTEWQQLWTEMLMNFRCSNSQPAVCNDGYRSWTMLSWSGCHNAELSPTFTVRL